MHITGHLMTWVRIPIHGLRTQLLSHDDSGLGIAPLPPQTNSEIAYRPACAMPESRISRVTLAQSKVVVIGVRSR